MKLGFLVNPPPPHNPYSRMLWGGGKTYIVNFVFLVYIVLYLLETYKTRILCENLLIFFKVVLSFMWEIAELFKESYS